MDDETLRERYRQLTERRGNQPGEPAVPLESIEALAEGRLSGTERLEVLDRVLADPRARAEYEFLRELAAAGARPAVRSRRWLIAAAVLAVVGGGLVWRASGPGGREPLRGPPALVVLLGPAEGDSLAPGGRLLWGRVPGALGYVVEILSPDGATAFRAETPDTTLVFAGAAITPGPALWTVVARMGGSAEQRSAPRKIVLRR